MNTQFEDNIYLIKHQPVDEREAGSSWGFNTYPSFAFTGLDFADLVNESGQFSENMYKFFGHEFAQIILGTT